MARLIQDEVKQPLAEELLFGKLAAGGEVHVSLKDGKLAFELTPAPPKSRPKKRKPKKAPEATKSEAKAEDGEQD
jgi:ATP-dependent Clp protease ATP-binding subunit ClpA